MDYGGLQMIYVRVTDGLQLPVHRAPCLRVAAQVCDSVAVMQPGQIVAKTQLSQSVDLFPLRSPVWHCLGRRLTLVEPSGILAGGAPA